SCRHSPDRDLLPASGTAIARPNFGNTETDGAACDYHRSDIMRPIRKAVFPVAGLGTRFLPATKAMPKEMLPVVDRPLIQHVVDEAREAGIEHFIFVTGRNKAVIEDHFDRQFELENTLAERLHMYGVVGIGTRKGGLFSVTQMVEKPAREKAPSDLIITGRYILQPEIFGVLAAERRGAGDEIQLTDAMIELARTQPFYGLEFEGRAFDCGSKVGFLAANIAYALERDDIAPAMRA